ncbi:hypothetical protein K9L97_03300 [Candidatus Woesearchaeota archaeon]|nr:hypothetical protein [Candidatus Woesearchaeota archaeon]
MSINFNYLNKSVADNYVSTATNLPKFSSDKSSSIDKLLDKVTLLRKGDVYFRGSTNGPIVRAYVKQKNDDKNYLSAINKAVDLVSYSSSESQRLKDSYASDSGAKFIR